MGLPILQPECLPDLTPWALLRGRSRGEWEHSIPGVALP
jgi:hypothetical protein